MASHAMSLIWWGLVWNARYTISCFKKTQRSFTKSLCPVCKGILLLFLCVCVFFLSGGTWCGGGEESSTFWLHYVLIIFVFSSSETKRTLSFFSFIPALPNRKQQSDIILSCLFTPKQADKHMKRKVSWGLEPNAGAWITCELDNTLCVWTNDWAGDDCCSRVSSRQLRGWRCFIMNLSWVDVGGVNHTCMRLSVTTLTL